MLNKIWAIMILVGVLYGGISGNLKAVTEAAMNSAGEGIDLCITMAGVTALWMGLMKIAEEAGLIAVMTKKIQPFLHFLFPRIPKGHPAQAYMATNVIANLLGLGWAATPAGLKAMEALADLERERKNEAFCREKIASNEMCNFLILNISSLELIPVNMIAYRSKYGSDDPTRIIVPALIATSVSTLTALIFCKCMDRRKNQ